MLLPYIQKRRSVRKYLPKSVEPEKVEMLIEAALRAPSSRGLNPWQFIVVTRPDLMEGLSRAKIHGSSFVKNAPLLFVICADSKHSDVWIEDASVATTFVMLTAETMGLGSCWVQIRERMHDKVKTSADYTRELLKIPAQLKVEAFLALGYPDETPPPHTRETLQHDKVFHEMYGARK